MLSSLRFLRGITNPFLVQERLVLPSEDDIERIYNLFKQMQAADSPLEKLELLLSAIAIIFHSVSIFIADF